MADLTIKQCIEKIKQAKLELCTSGPIHSRDLHKHIKRLEARLKRLRMESR